MDSCVLPKDLHIDGLLRMNLPCIQDQCVMVTKKVSLEHDEILDDHEVYIQSRSKEINSQYPKLFVEYKDSRGNIRTKTSWSVFNMAHTEEEMEIMEYESVQTPSTSSHEK